MIKFLPEDIKTLLLFLKIRSGANAGRMVSLIVLVNIVPDKEKIPGFAKTEHYKGIFEWFTKPNEERETIVELANKLNVTRQTVYDILRHEYTKNKLKEYFDSLATADQGEMYDSLKELANRNPHASKLWHEYYSIIRPKTTGATGNIIINLGIFPKEDKKDEGEFKVIE